MSEEIQEKANSKEELPQTQQTAAPEPQDVAEAGESTAKDAEAARPSQPSAEDLLKDDIGELKIRKAKGSKNITHGICKILATFNNTKVSFADMNGNVISWSSAGKCNFRGSRKSTAYAAQVVTQDAGRVAMSHGLKEVLVRVEGPGMGRDSAIRAVQAMGMNVTGIEDVTPVPHNGCRPPKRRRV
ncbi:MAG TPA: 30S ribosomal protein S11 [Opitutae bacterium]|nr:30S ribosomal protein S11 [Opitutae bacterium]|tara:strand:- start:436 stop:993 length:558 start_codon:yes stop_codon:yes gene_type:complete